MYSGITGAPGSGGSPWRRNLPLARCAPRRPLHRFGFAIAVLLLLHPLTARAQDVVRPAWFDRVQFLQTVHSIDELPEDVYTGLCWGPIPSPGQPPLEADRWRRLGGPYIMSVSATTDWNNEYEPSDPSDRMVDLDGEPADHPLPPSNPRYTIVSPKWQAFLREKVRLAIDQGADGIHFGDAQTPPGTFERWNKQQATFDPVTMEAFRGYLQRKFTQAELVGNLGIADITTFHLADWIKANDRREDWNAEPWGSLARQFHIFLLTETKNFFRKTTAFAHSYARDTYGREFTVSAHISFGVAGHFLLDELDYFVNGHSSFDEAGAFANLDVKSARAIRDWPVAVLPQPRKPGLPAKVGNMMKLLLADIYSSGGTVAFGKELTDTLEPAFPTLEVDAGVLRNYSSFIRNSPALFQDLKPVTELGLIDSSASKGGGNWNRDPELPYAGADPSYHGIGSLLIDLNLQFLPLFAPDSRFSTLPSFTLEDLRRHKLVVAPHIPMLSDGQVDVLRQYVEEGGVIVASGYLGTHTEDGAAIQRALPAGGSQGGGVFPAGAGHVLRTGGFEGFEYIEGTKEGRAQLRDDVRALLDAYIQPLVKVSNAAPEYRYGGGTVFLYESPQRDWIAHIVNYDFDEFADKFSTKTDLDLEIRVGSRNFDEAVFVSPEETAPLVLPMERNGDTVKMRIPRLQAYGIVILQRNAHSPELHGAGAARQRHVVAGGTVSVAARATDADGNTLFARWYVDGVLDPYARGMEYRFQSQPGSGGSHEIRLVASDGGNEVTAEWTVVVEPYTFPKVVFDESSGERNSIDLSTSVSLSPEHPEWVSFAVLNRELEKEFLVTRHIGDTITERVLDENDVLVLATPAEPLTQLEIDLVVSSVAAGKGLLVLGNAELPEGVNRLLERFGISFSARPIFGPGAAGVDTPEIAYFVAHPAVGENPAFRSSWGGSFSVVNPPAFTLGLTDGQSWRNLDSNSVRDPNEPGGPFPVLVAAEFGKGRVWCSSDNAFHDSALAGDLSNANLFLAGLRWVSEASMTRLPPAFTAQGVVNAASYSGGSVAPGEIVTVFGTSLAHPNLVGLQLSQDGRFVRNELEGARLFFDDTPAPLLYTSASQLSAVVPLAVSGRGATEARIGYLDGWSAPVTLPVVQAVPGLFTVDSSGQGQGAILNRDASLNSASNPAPRGSIVSVYGTSGGRLEPAALDGEIAVEAKWLQLPVTAAIGGESAEVIYAGASPGLVNGVVQFNIKVPNGIPATDAAPIAVSVGGQWSRDGVTLAIR